MVAELTVPESVDDLERRMLAARDNPILHFLTEQEVVTRHFFAPGLYARSVTRPAGAFLIGHRHRTEHMNIVLHGRMVVYMDGVVKEVCGPSLPFVSKAGARKATYALEESTLITFHPTKETDLDKLEDELVEKTEIFKEMERDGVIALLRGHTATLEQK